jgi:hypothetical protein
MTTCLAPLPSPSASPTSAETFRIRRRSERHGPCTTPAVLLPYRSKDILAASRLPAMPFCDVCALMQLSRPTKCDWGRITSEDRPHKASFPLPVAKFLGSVPLSQYRNTCTEYMHSTLAIPPSSCPRCQAPRAETKTQIRLCAIRLDASTEPRRNDCAP